MKELDSLLNTVKILRSDGGCPWDRAQKVDDMKKYLLEEIYELIDGINLENSEIIKEETGDVFLIVVVLTEMFREKGAFDLKIVLDNINKKLISRHPHVFLPGREKSKEEVLKHWVKEKAKKKKRKSIRDRLPVSAPSLLLADIFFKESSYLGKKHKNPEGCSAFLSEVKDKIGSFKHKKSKQKFFSDLIFDICKIAHECGIDLENILRKAVFNEADKVHYSGRKK